MCAASLAAVLVRLKDPQWYLGTGHASEVLVGTSWLAEWAGTGVGRYCTGREVSPASLSSEQGFLDGSSPPVADFPDREGICHW